MERGEPIQNHVNQLYFGDMSYTISNTKGDNSMDISVGDVVFVKNDKTKRSFWKIGIIQEIITRQDGYFPVGLTV